MVGYLKWVLDVERRVSKKFLPEKVDGWTEKFADIAEPYAVIVDAKVVSPIVKKATPAAFWVKNHIEQVYFRLKSYAKPLTDKVLPNWAAEAEKIVAEPQNQDQEPSQVPSQEPSKEPEQEEPPANNDGLLEFCGEAAPSPALSPARSPARSPVRSPARSNKNAKNEGASPAHSDKRVEVGSSRDQDTQASPKRKNENWEPVQQQAQSWEPVQQQAQFGLGQQQVHGEGYGYGYGYSTQQDQSLAQPHYTTYGEAAATSENKKKKKTKRRPE